MGLRMKEPETLAYINLYGLLGALKDLCALSPEARRLADTAALPGGKALTVGFVVKNGPAMTLRFGGGSCEPEIGEGPCTIRLPFSSCAKFNGLIDGTVTPIPTKGFTKVRFLTKNFMELTRILEKYLRASPEDLAEPDFFKASTAVMFFLIAQAVVQIGNHDKIGRFTASNMVDGVAALSIANYDGGAPLQAGIVVKDHVLSLTRELPGHYHALMEFSGLRLTRDLFDGKVSALGCVGQGLITMRGNLGMLDNINRILDRAAVYLA
jgi:hypothetical protein